MGASMLLQRTGQHTAEIKSSPQSPSTPLGGPSSVAPTRERDPEDRRRIRELEDELRALRAENEKQVISDIQCDQFAELED